MSNEKQLTGAPLRQPGSQVVPTATSAAEEQAATTSAASLEEATRDTGMPMAEEAPPKPSPKKR